MCHEPMTMRLRELVTLSKYDTLRWSDKYRRKKNSVLKRLIFSMFFKQKKRSYATCIPLAFDRFTAPLNDVLIYFFPFWCWCNWALEMFCRASFIDKICYDFSYYHKCHRNYGVFTVIVSIDVTIWMLPKQVFMFIALAIFTITSVSYAFSNIQLIWIKNHGRKGSPITTIFNRIE